MHTFIKKGVRIMYWLAGIIGVIFVAAPFIFSYSENVLGFWTSVVVGVILMGIEIGKLFSRPTHYRHLR